MPPKKVHELPPEKLRQRDVVHIDISNDTVSSNDYKRDEDPSIFKSRKTNRGPLVGNWMERVSCGDFLAALLLFNGAQLEC